MHVRSLVCFLATLFFLFGSICEVDASSTSSVSFQGAGVIVDLTFPEEAHPTESITHNLTITANTSLTLENFTIIIRVLVNSSWQQVSTDARTGRDMAQNEKLPIPLKFTLPQNSHGRLYCFIYVLTDKIADPSSYIFYTTDVRTLTYEELLSKYNESLTNYSDLLADYETLLQSYNAISIDYGTLNSTYTSLLNDYDTLQSNYNSLNSTYYSLQAGYDSLLSSYNALEADYNSLNQTYTTLENEISDLNQRIDASKTALNNTRILLYLFIGTTIALIVLVIYIKKKKPEPYIVIRKETVAVKSTEDS